jgi:hypothetical protein
MNAFINLSDSVGSTPAELKAVVHTLGACLYNVWRLSFVGALFVEWWVLSGKDPKPSLGPRQDFICAARYSPSPLAASTDADGGSAITVALARSKPGQWRVV